MCSNYTPEDRKEEVHDKNPNYKNELLSQIERKQLEEERRKLMDKSYALEQNQKSKQQQEEVPLSKHRKP